MKKLENKQEIFELINEISYDLDQKNIVKALETFTEDARLSLVENGSTILDLSGKKQILSHLQKKLEDVDVLFHNNGTSVIQVLSLDQKAIAHTSSIVKMIAKGVETDECLYFNDKLIKVNGYWYVVERTIEIAVKSVH